jgi:membrane-bound metal-dependent hydrolase YbcI (DUF457 family)
MPDLFTHLVAARVPGAFLRDRRLQALLVIGTFLPDIASKGFVWVLGAREEFAHASHSILGVVLVAYLASLFIEESIRRPGFYLLAAGGLIHILVDLFKCYLENGSVALLLPFSPKAYEFGLIYPENVVFLIPINAAILAATWFLERRCARVQQ